MADIDSNMAHVLESLLDRLRQHGLERAEELNVNRLRKNICTSVQHKKNVVITNSSTRVSVAQLSTNATEIRVFAEHFGSIRVIRIENSGIAHMHLQVFQYQPRKPLVDLIK